MTSIEVPPVEGFWGPAKEIGLGLSNWETRDAWLKNNLSQSQQRLAACAFARRVLYIFESRHQGDYRPRSAVETAELVAMGMLRAESRWRKSRRSAVETAELVAMGLAASEGLSNSRRGASAAATYAAADATYDAVASADATYAAAADDAADAATAAAAYATAAAAYADAAASDAAGADDERLEQARILTLFLPCDSVISESSKGLANRWIHSYLNHGVDEKGVREILADSLQDDGVPEDRCQWVRHVETWSLGMWPMTVENFS